MSAHSLAMLMTQSASSCGAENDTSETIQRIARTDLTKPIDYTVDIERYRGVRGGAKKPPMPADIAKKHVLPLKVLASKVISTNRAKEMDFCFLQDVITSETCP